MDITQQQDSFSAWNPGIESDIPASYRELETIYHPDNVLTHIDEIQQLVSDTGLSQLELIRFRPHRLALHELIVRVTADIVVLEGETEEDLGINFRHIANQILTHHVQPQMSAIEAVYEEACYRIEQVMQLEMERVVERMKPAVVPAPTLWQRLFTRSPLTVITHQTREEREYELINEFKSRQLETDDEFNICVYRSIYRVLGSIARTRGFLGNDTEYLGYLCTLHAINEWCSRVIGRQVGEWVNQAIKKEGFSFIPEAQKPVLVSLKGASASGKSHLRPLLRNKLATLGIQNSEYGTISPDIWRKLLLDYESLGDSYKYAGRFTSHEVSVIDAKLDRYIRDKSEHSHSIPHLVVDRFRFDSFASEKVSRVLHNTYVRYIDSMYMYFIITPPEATVERGWLRGLERGRYKAVEDYLGHCVEAYEGMPKLLFKWLSNDKPRYSFKFIDNSVSKGSAPKMIARGTQGWMQIFDPTRFIDIERYKRINIHATSPQQVHDDANALSIKHNLGFLQQCIQRIKSIEFADTDSELTYLEIESGTFQVVNHELFQSKLKEPTVVEILAALAPDLLPE